MFVYSDDNTLGVEPELSGRAIEDALVSLVGHKPVDVRGLIAGLRQGGTDHLTDVDDRVAEDLGAPGAVPSVVTALAAKYTRPEDQQYLPDHDPDFDVVYALRPQSAMCWRLDDYAASQRRWSTVLW